MDVKGIAVINTRDFVKTKFPQRYENWVNSLPLESQKIYKANIGATTWYSMVDAYIIPLDKIVETFYENDAQRGGNELGTYSATSALKGIYKIFLLVATPQYLMKNATKILSSYYVPSETIISAKGENEVTVQISNFPEISKVLEFRIAAWCKRAVELTNKNDVAYAITKSISKGDPVTEIVFNWS
jgi:hypothetical protein